MQLPFRKENQLNLSNPRDQQIFSQAHNTEELLHKELDINLAEQALLLKRIHLMKDLTRDLSPDDGEYSMLLIQSQMDQVELDELKNRESMITDHLQKRKQGGIQ